MVREEVMRRSGSRCEVMVELPSGRWTRCGRQAAEDHHMLKRSRGGEILDAVGEIYHHIALCHQHHRQAEMENDWSAGLIISGYVTTGPVYHGPDEYLRSKYGD